MPSLLHRALLAVENTFDWSTRKVHDRFGRIDPLRIQAYNSFGTPRGVEVMGRLLEDKRLGPPRLEAPMLYNMLTAFRRFDSDEVPGARLEVRLGDAREETQTDGEGYFRVHLEPSQPLDTRTPWHQAEVRLLDEGGKDQPPGSVTTRADILVPHDTARFGVLSDLDDTVLKTGATNKLTMLRNTIFHSAETRLPFEGVAAFYRALQAGASGKDGNPFFYVSSSPWNLYDLLHDFLEVHDIPEGPLLLRDLGLSRDQFIKSSHESHKLEQIRSVLETYPDLPFVLLGDSGQHDPEIYHRVVQEHAGRVQAVYIRYVEHAPARRREVERLADEAERVGVPFLLVPDTDAAARHAAGRGWVQ